MAVGPNYVLDKGYLVQGVTAIVNGELAVDGTVDQSAIRSGVNGDVTGVFQESVDAVRVTTGKVIANVRLLGIANVLAGAAVAKGDRVKADATARAISSVQVAAGLQPAKVFGRALNAASGAGVYFTVLLTPGATY